MSCLTPTEIEAALHRAREHRARGDGQACLDEFTTIEEADWTSTAAVRLAWKHAKAKFDFSDHPPIEALRPALSAAADLFRPYPPSRRAAQRLARHHQDHWGYEEPLLLDLWTALIDACRTHGDVIGAAAARLDRAWFHLCRGELHELEDDLSALARIEEATIQLGSVYTRLCFANWSLDGDLATTAHAMTIAQLDDQPAPEHVEVALAEAEQRFALEAPPPAHRSDYLDALRGLRSFEGIADARRIVGPEHQLAAAQSAQLAGQGPAVSARWGCAIFSAADPEAFRVP